MDIKRRLKSLIEPAELVKVTPHNFWSLSVFTDIKPKRKQVDTITAGRPEPVDCRGQR